MTRVVAEISAIDDLIIVVVAAIADHDEMDRDGMDIAAMNTEVVVLVAIAVEMVHEVREMIVALDTTAARGQIVVAKLAESPDILFGQKAKIAKVKIPRIAPPMLGKDRRPVGVGHIHVATKRRELLRVGNRILCVRLNSVAGMVDPIKVGAQLLTNIGRKRRLRRVLSLRLRAS